MNCPTCDHEMNDLGYCNGGTWRHCPRCGTAYHYDGISRGDHAPTVIVPVLVERCQEFEYKTSPAESWCWNWRGFGIKEAIHKPEDRP